MKVRFGWFRCLLERWDDFEWTVKTHEYVWWNIWSLNDTGKRLIQRIDEFWPTPYGPAF